MIFKEGHDEADGRRDLTTEGIHLARMLTRLLPTQPEARDLAIVRSVRAARAGNGSAG